MNEFEINKNIIFKRKTKNWIRHESNMQPSLNYIYLAIHQMGLIWSITMVVMDSMVEWHLELIK